MKIKVTMWHIILAFTLILSFFPLLWMISIAFKESTQIFSHILNPFPMPFTLENFQHVWSSVPILRYLGNSFLVSSLVTVFQLFTSLLAAYAFTQFTFRGREFLFYVVVASILIPIQVTMLPNYLLLSEIGLVNTYAGLILPQLANGLGVFLLRQSFRSIPYSLLEAASVDGTGDWGKLWKIMVPAVRPSIIALGILFFITTWNEYLWPLLVIKDDNMLTIPLALQLFISSEGGNSWGPMMAIAFLASLPPLIAFFVLQKYIISSFLHTGVK
jgi:sn-glycerol 3-phosphate transport system permease protein